MLGWCEHVDHPDDSPRSEGDFFPARGWFAEDYEVIFLCKEHQS